MCNKGCIQKGVIAPEHTCFMDRQIDAFIIAFIEMLYCNLDNISLRRKKIHGLEDLVEMVSEEPSGAPHTSLFILRKKEKLNQAFINMVNTNIANATTSNIKENAVFIGTFQKKLKQTIQKELKYNFNIPYINALNMVNESLNGWILDFDQISIL